MNRLASRRRVVLRTIDNDGASCTDVADVLAERFAVKRDEDIRRITNTKDLPRTDHDQECRGLSLNIGEYIALLVHVVPQPLQGLGEDACGGIRTVAGAPGHAYHKWFAHRLTPLCSQRTSTPGIPRGSARVNVFLTRDTYDIPLRQDAYSLQKRCCNARSHHARPVDRNRRHKRILSDPELALIRHPESR